MIAITAFFQKGKSYRSCTFRIARQAFRWQVEGGCDTQSRKSAAGTVDMSALRPRHESHGHDIAGSQSDI